ncbi:MAG: SAM-dependent methyltransferase [Solirubrobacteraceae bacterium]
MTDRALLSALRHGDRPFHDPLEPELVDEVVAFAGLGPGDRALDVGCGPGELLVRLAERTGCGGLGVDVAEIVVAEARRRAAARAPQAPLRFEARDAAGLDETFDLTASLGASHALGGLDATLERLAALTRPGGHVLIGDGFWSAEPPQAYLDALGGATRDELPDGLPALVGSGDRHGLRAMHVRVASEDDWDRYEWTLIANGERHLAANPGAPEEAALRELNDRSRARVLGPGGRGTMGFALILYARD